VEEEVDRGRVPKVVAQYRECPNEGPTVGMQLGGGHVDFCQQRPLEASEGETQLIPLEDGLVEEEEGLSFVSSFVGAHRFALDTWSNENVSITFVPKDTPYTVRLAFPMIRHVHAGSK